MMMNPMMNSPMMMNPMMNTPMMATPMMMNPMMMNPMMAAGMGGMEVKDPTKEKWKAMGWREKDYSKPWEDWTKGPWEDWSKPVAKKVTLPKESAIVQAGLPETAPAIPYHKAFEIFS